MIVVENIVIDGANFTRTYSDKYQIRKVGTTEIYTDAIDVLEFTYEETVIPLETQPPTEGDMKEALSILGVQA